jgi:hypothetical protein
MASSFSHGNKPFGSIKADNLLTSLNMNFSWKIHTTKMLSVTLVTSTATVTALHRTLQVTQYASGFSFSSLLT